MNVNNQLDIKELRTKLYAKQATSEQKRQRSEQAITNLKAIFASLDEEKLNIIESRGIHIRNLLSYDLDKLKDRDYYNRFSKAYAEVLSGIEDILRIESGAN